jgi:hypothetical protein
MQETIAPGGMTTRQFYEWLCDNPDRVAVSGMPSEEVEKIKESLRSYIGDDGPELCHDCGADTTTEYYLVHDQLRASAGMAPDGGFLCVGCIETRLGRELNAADFRDVLVNTDPDFTWRNSPRLAAQKARLSEETGEVDHG